jgi:1-acyl-sn-glycerol-3-phosphate acyltransferase
MALRHGAAIVPVAIVGSEESWPVLARLRTLHPFGAPYLPVPALPLPLPLRYQLHYGEPIRLTDKPDPATADDPAAVRDAADRVRRELELLLREALALRKAQRSL